MANVKCLCAFTFQISFVSDDRNDRTAGTTGKPERPQSQNGRKAETTGKAGTTGLIPASIQFCALFENAHYRRDVPVQ
jgi:hypothetical protein